MGGGGTDEDAGAEEGEGLEMGAVHVADLDPPRGQGLPWVHDWHHIGVTPFLGPIWTYIKLTTL